MGGSLARLGEKMKSSFEERLARVIGRTLGSAVGLLPVVLLGCDGPVLGGPSCGGNTPTHTTYLVVDDGAACPAPEDASVDLLSQLGCPCPVIEATEVCGEAARNDTPLDGAGVELVGKDACGYVAVGTDLGVCCGRPLLREGAPVMAPLGGTSDWSSEHTVPDLSTLSATERALLATYWREVARMEHASIASFSRFTLELLAHGAPGTLLADAQQAGLDEVHHARDAFALASVYAGERIAPGPMDLAGVQIGGSLVELAVACVREGCIGETIAAVEAAHRLVSTTDPAVARALRQVVEEEGRHAAMAWRALSWLLEQGGEAAWVAVDAAFAEPLAPLSGPVQVGAAVQHGLLPQAGRNAAQQQAWSEVIQPAWQAMRGGHIWSDRVRVPDRVAVR